MLGHVMTHELGHLLLGSNRHSDAGVMRPRWSDRDLFRAQMGALQFTSAQADRMRLQVNARTLRDVNRIVHSTTVLGGRSPNFSGRSQDDSVSQSPIVARSAPTRARTGARRDRARGR
jgi:hypothetical protein